MGHLLDAEMALLRKGEAPPCGPRGRVHHRIRATERTVDGASSLCESLMRSANFVIRARRPFEVGRIGNEYDEGTGVLRVYQ